MEKKIGLVKSGQNNSRDSYHNNKYVIIIFVIFISWNEAKLSYVCVWHNMTLLEMHIQLLIYLKQMNIYG